MEMSYLEILREAVEKQYQNYPTGCGGSFGEILCWEMHENDLYLVGRKMGNIGFRNWGIDS